MMRTLVLLLAATLLVPQGVPVTKPQFVDGLAQPVFADQAVIRHNVWVEVPNLDTRSRRRERSDARADLAAGRNGCRREAADRARGQPVQRRHAAVSAARHHRAAVRCRAIANAQPRALIEPPPPASAALWRRRSDSRHRARRISGVLPAARLHLRAREFARHRTLDRLSDDRRPRREHRDESDHRLVQRPGKGVRRRRQAGDGLLDHRRDGDDRHVVRRHAADRRRDARRRRPQGDRARSRACRATTIIAVPTAWSSTRSRWSGPTPTRSSTTSCRASIRRSAPTCATGSPVTRTGRPATTTRSGTSATTSRT